MSSSSSYEDFVHLKIPFKEIVSATNNFSDANLIEESALMGKAYKGKLLRSNQQIDIVAQRFDHEHRDRVTEFLKEILKLKHKNLVSMFGFCDEVGMIIIYHEAKGSLDTYLGNPELTWMKRLQICVGVAYALSYIYYDNPRDFSVIRCDIRSSKILLDDNWEAKLSGFEISQKNTAAQRNESLMSSFGKVLIEVLCGNMDVGNASFVALFISKYEETRLDGMIDPGLWKQMDPQSFRIFSEIAYYCLKEKPSQCPNIGVVVMELEKTVESQWRHERALISHVSVEGTTSKNLEGNELKHLEIPLKDIKLATKKFTQTVIGEGTYGDVYRAELDHFDRKVFLSLEKKKKGGVPPKKRSTVAIKRIKIRKDKQGEEGFDAEIKMLTCCDHQNIVSLLGFCKDRHHIILVYEYVSKGSLDSYLGSTNNFLNLNWVQRVKMCIDIAHGLKYLHTKAGKKARIIHRDIKSGNILLNENWEAKIADFGLSKYGTENTKENSLHTVHIAGTEVYLDPEYEKKGKLTTATDIYSFGVVLFEILSGTLAYDPVYTKEHPRGIAHVAHRRLKEGTMNDMVDHRLWETTHENSSTISTRPNQYSLHAFFKVAYRCLEDTQAKRPTAKHIIKKLQDVLCLQETNLKRLPISFIDIRSATQDFSITYLTGSDAYGKVYTAALDHFDSNYFFSLQEKTRDELHMKSCSTVVIRRILVRKDKQQGFLADIRMLTTYKHPNVVSLLGFCEEGTSIILIYEHASKGSLRDYLGNIGYLGNLTWVQRLKICIDIARGLIYLHRPVEDKPSIIHGHITSGSILFTENWQAKIADLGLSKFCHKNQKPSTMDKKGNIVHTQVYMDPEYHPSNKQSDIYSFGVILFEILSGRLAYDSIYTKKNTKGIATVAQQRFHNETIEEMVDPRLMEETDENISTLNKRPYLDSLDVFSEIAYKCVAETQARRPSAEEIVKKLEEALSLQENPSDYKKFLLKDIELATHNFSDSNLIGRGRFGNLYKGEVTHANGRNAIAAKRLDMKHGHGEPQFSNELKVLMNNKHKNIIGLVGYCKKMNEKILVYEYASRQSLDKHLSDSGLTWMKRLEICIDISSGLDFLHGGEATHKLVIHRDINSSNVLLTDDWKAKISDFRISLIIPINEDLDSVIDKAYGTHGYVDPLYEVSHCLTKESDVYSLGIVLFEILCGRLGYDARKDSYLSQLVEHKHNEGKLGELVFEGIKDQIAPKSLTEFQSIALKCLHRKREERPTTYEVLQQLKKALEFQEDYEIWKPRLPKNYKKIFLQMSNSLDISNQREKDLYNMLCNGILLEEDKVLFAQDRNGDRNEMISAKTFSYINHCRYRWRSVPESRFRVVAQMLDIMNLNVKMKTKAPNRLSPDVVYGVYLVFKFCDPRTVSTKPVYVNLKYKNGGETAETSHAYFATWRDNEWMMIELCRFLNNRGHIIFKFLLESFSRYYCGDSNIYVQGIEFRAIDNAEHENLEGLMDVQEVLTSNSYVDWIRTLLPFGLPTRLRSIYSLPTRLPSIYGLRTSLSSVRSLGTSQATSITNFFSRNDDAGEQISINVNGRKHHLVSAKAALHNYSEVECFKTQQTDQYRFPEVIELLPQQVFGIKCTIISRMLSRDTNYVCCLVFKLSDTCRGLHCPVKVRDLPHFENKDDEIIYFRSPSPRNLHDSNQAPIPRADGWMEVRIWKFNLNEVLKNYYLSVDLKLISYEGTVSGLIIGGLEFRPIS